jgi:hypothetical protein
MMNKNKNKWFKIYKKWTLVYIFMTNPNPDSSLTFVTCYLNVYNVDFDNRNIEWRTQHFRKILLAEMNYVIFISPEYEGFMSEMTKDFPNVILKKIDFRSMVTYHEIMDMEPGYLSLPSNRNENKDTAEYITLMHSKVELMKIVIDENPWNSTHFSWIDFNIAYIFKETEKTQNYLRVLSRRHFMKKCLIIPGCWGKLPADDVGRAYDCIHWRFCGGFFLGDAGSILEFNRYYREHLVQFLLESRKLVWEVNFWAWLEAKHDWAPLWFLADHNDSMVKFTADYYSLSLLDGGKATFQEYEYPEIYNFYPTSACYLFHDGKDWLNTRYVNYWLYPNACYLFHNSERIIENKNILSELDPSTLLPINYYEMRENIGLENNPKAYSQGIEDLRLYTINGQVKFVASTLGYSPSGRIRIMNGDYDLYTNEYRNCAIIEPPGDTYCEKNWVPILRKNVDTGLDEELFIYKWMPMEIGRIAHGTSTLEIIERYEIRAPLFHRVRGSAPFIETADGMLGIVHFSEEYAPRHYYHMMVLLEKETYRPLKYSRTFTFRTLGVEFCIGMRILDEKYTFWISRHDRDPMMVQVDMAEIPLVFDF